MFSSPGAGKSVDSLSPLSPGARGDHNLHRLGHPHPRSTSRRGSAASSIQSVGGALDSASSAWPHPLHESGQNAISTLLQPPIVRTGLQPHTSAPTSSAHRPPTTRDIPPVTLTNIPRVDADEFSPYLAQVGALYEQLRRVKDSDTEGPSSRRGSKQDEQTEAVTDGNLLRPSTKSRPRKGSTASISSIGSVDPPSPMRRPSSVFGRRSTNQGPPPLSTIPTVYFDEDFHLENPRTFDVVSERSEVIRPATTSPQDDGAGNSTKPLASASPRKALATNAILQEKLSWYMDTIEVHLINSISTASSTFFSALGSLKELHSEAADSVERIKALRQELQALDEEITSTGLQVVQKRRRQENLHQLNQAVAQLRRIADGIANCEILVDAGEVEQALGGIDTLESLIVGEQDAKDTSQPVGYLRDLSGAVALQGVNADLSTLRYRIGKAYDSQFSTSLLADLRRHVESISLAEILLRWGNAASRARGGHGRTPSVFPTYLSATAELKAQLAPSMIGLSRAKHVSTAASVYRESVLREIKSIIRRPLPSSSDDDNESMMSVSTSGGRHLSNHEKSTNLARNLRALDPEDAEELLTKIYIGVAETLRRLTTQVKVLLDIASSLAESPDGDGMKSPPVRSPVSSPKPDRHEGAFGAPLELQEELHKAFDVSTLLGQAVDVAHEKVVKLLRVRTEQTTHLPLDMFLRYFTLNLYFANECEAISGRSGTPLKTVVNGHIKDFVQRNRDAEMQKLAQGMESDQWNAKDFTDENSQMLDDILSCSTHDAEAWTNSNKIWVPPQDNLNSEATPEANGTNKDAAGKEKSRSAVIETEKFVLPNSAVLCLEGITNFLHLIAGIPSMTTDVASSLITYLQLFNSRCTQLILGAGATKSAGLKNITTKHLALASQALSFIATLIPHVREYVRRHAGSGSSVSNLMGEFDKVRRLLQEHQDSIHQKLVEIMSGRAAIHSKSLKAVNWDSDSSEGPHAFVETLAKETTTLHRVLTKHLPETSIQMIMLPVFASYKEQIGGAFEAATPKTTNGQKSMLRDLEFLSSRLGKIDGFEDTGEYLTKIVNAKNVDTEEDAADEASDDTDKAKEVDTSKRSSSEKQSPEKEANDQEKGAS